MIIESYNFIRVILTFFIFIYHFFIHINNYEANTSFFTTFEFSTAPTVCFFILSGALLYNRYKKDMDIKSFYIKRFKNVLIPYYIVYLYQYIKTSSLLHTPFFVEGSKFKVLLFIFALDGYLNKYFTTYHMNTGEWFLGILVILYIIYPLIVKLLDKYGRAFIVFVYIIFAIRLLLPFQYGIKDFVFCFTSFFTGMAISKYDFLHMKRSGNISLLVLFLMILKGNGALSIMSDFLYIFLLSIVLFIVLYYIGNMIYRDVKNKPIKNIMNFLSSVSYEFFLVHHIILFKVFDKYGDKNLKQIVLFFIAFIYSLLIAVILKKLVNIIYIVINKVFRKA